MVCFSCSLFFVPHIVFNLRFVSRLCQKVGGWRKLWFVLQNQLLLSYSSKEDYEKKLAPFKDVLNLVPGVIVRPTKGPRFTIETPTNLIYTYVSVVHLAPRATLNFDFIGCARVYYNFVPFIALDYLSGLIPIISDVIITRNVPNG